MSQVDFDWVQQLGGWGHATDGFDLSNVLRPELKALCEETNETASFYIREGDNRICLYRVEPSRSIRHSIVEGASMPLKKGASGKILSAFSANLLSNSQR